MSDIDRLETMLLAAVRTVFAEFRTPSARPHHVSQKEQAFEWIGGNPGNTGREIAVAICGPGAGQARIYQHLLELERVGRIVRDHSRPCRWFIAEPIQRLQSA